MGMSAGTLRRMQRRVHLIAAVLLAAYVYAPFGDDLETVIRFGVFPVVSATGIAMWQAARIRRTMRSFREPRIQA